MEVGTAAPDAEELVDGWLEVTGIPTGGPERLPVVIANGGLEGPTLWLTGGVHGDEATGIAVVQRVVRTLRDSITLGDLAGAIVCIPVVNPAGLRRNERTSYYGDDDPNRYFPDIERDSTRPPETQERIDTRLFEAIRASADLLIDCHTAQIGSVPFTIRDRVLFGSNRTETEAEALSAQLERLVDAFGLPVLREYPAEEYLDQSLQRSTAGAALNTAGILAFTAELGAHSVVEDETLHAGVAGVFEVAVEFGMLEAVPVAASSLEASPPTAPVDFPVRRYVGPRTETAGLLRHRAAPGDPVKQGDVVAEVRTPHGAVIETVEAEHDGYLIARSEGLAVYEGTPVASMAVRDEDALVVSRESATA